MSSQCPFQASQKVSSKKATPSYPSQELIRFSEMTRRSTISNPLSSLTYHIKHLSDNDVAGITLIEFHCTVLGRVGVGKIPFKIFSSSEDCLVKLLGKPTMKLVQTRILTQKNVFQTVTSGKFMCTRATSRCPPAQVWGAGMGVSKFFLKELFMTNIVHLAVSVNFQLKYF